MDQDKMLKIIGAGASTIARAETLEELDRRGMGAGYLVRRLKRLCEAKRTKSQWISGSDGVYDKDGSILVDPLPPGWQHTTHEDNATQMQAVTFLAELLEARPPRVQKNINLDLEAKLSALVLAKAEEIGLLGMDDIEDADYESDGGVGGETEYDVAESGEDDPDNE